ncbi:HupE/UreJ family protein [Ramlibacter albus]|uniref:HupE/UreJ family protein n=1 Tax=Ramlibacter albus TaxID=2079448 RepID=A0A923S146_9BURK|nr:HupE/UreJ family protein [Ramlibacter albus]MBC5763910.1 HupE/UreJ family protein [Ramlibacter albus]
MRRWLLLLAFALLCGRAAAHLMPQGQGAVKFDDAGAFAMVAVPVRAFAVAGDRIGPAEHARLRAQMEQQLPSLIELRSDGQAGRVLVSQAMLPGKHELGERTDSDYVVTMLRVVWDTPPRDVTLAMPWLERTGAPLMLQAQRGNETEAVLLTAHYSQHRFFEGSVATLLRFVGMGAEHILLGADHLIFLLTVLVVGAGWRYWAAVVTSFTVAHSVTLTLGVLGWVTVPASIAEPMIAASIVLMAWINLRGGEVRLAQRSAIVFACGLVHGLGFARALGELGGTGSKWLQLAGFNLGVEVGQLMFVAAALLALALLRRAVPMFTQPRIARATSWSAAGLGVLLLATLLVLPPA